MQEWQDAKSAFDEAYANATDQQRAEVDGYLQSAQNYSSANPMNNRSTRQYETQVYTNALGMLTGQADPARGATQSTANLFNRYSQKENINNANSVLADYRKKNQQRQVSTGGTYPSSNQLYFTYNWNKGLDSDWTLNSDTLENRMNSFTNTLAQNLQEAKNQSAQGKKLVGISNESIDNALAALQGKTWSKENFKDLMQIAKGAGVSASGFKSYFGDLFPGQDPTSQKIQALQRDGYTIVENGDYGEELNKLIQSRGYKVATKGGKNYLIGSDYSGPVLDAKGIFFNTDWDPNKEGRGYIIGNDGTFVYGDLNKYYDDSNSPWKAQINEYLTSLNNSDRAHWKTYNQFTDLSDLALINDNNQTFHNRSIADMSQYFDIDSPVIATVNGDNWDKVTSKYGHVKLDDQNLTYYWVKDGQNKSGTYQQFLQDTGAKKTLTKTTKRGDTAWSGFIPNLNQFNISDREDFFTTDANRRSGFVNFFSNNWYNQTNSNLWTNDKIDADQDIGKNKDGVARLLVQLYGTPDSELTDEQKKIKNNWWDNNPQQAVWLIYNQLKNSNYTLFNGDYQQDYIRNWKMILNNVVKDIPEFSTTPVQAEKEGGIIKAAEGTYINASGNVTQGPQKKSYASNIRAKAKEIQDDRDAVRARADEYGRTMTQQRASEGKWTASDTLRATALATDIVGLIGAATGAATGGIGSAVAVGSGFASMGMDAIADFTDDKVSKGQAVKNMAINTGLAVGAMFGAKAPKIVKSVVKLLPKAMMAAGAAGIAFDPEVHNTVKRISEGKTMNTGDWKNIITVLRTVAGIATVGTVEGGAKKYAKEYQADVEANTKKLLSTSSELDPNIRYVKKVDGDGVVQVDKKVLSDAEALLKKNDVDGARAKLAEGNVSEADIDAILITDPNKRGYNPFKKEFWKPGETTKVNTALTEQEARLANNPSIAAQARLKALQANQRQFNAAKKRFKVMNWLDEKTPFIDQQNYYQNAALADAAESGSSVKNIAELRKQLQGKVTPLDTEKVIREMESKALEERDPNKKLIIISNLINTLKERGLSTSNPKVKNLIQEERRLKSIIGASSEVPFTRSGGNINYNKLRK